MKKFEPVISSLTERIRKISATPHFANSLIILPVGTRTIEFDSLRSAVVAFDRATTVRPFSSPFLHLEFDLKKKTARNTLQWTLKIIAYKIIGKKAILTKVSRLLSGTGTQIKALSIKTVFVMCCAAATALLSTNLI